MGCLWGSDTPTLDGPKAKLSDVCVCVGHPPLQGPASMRPRAEWGVPELENQTPMLQRGPALCTARPGLRGQSVEVLGQRGGQRPCGLLPSCSGS